jgi:hypothetical protein
VKPKEGIWRQKKEARPEGGLIWLTGSWYHIFGSFVPQDQDQVSKVNAFQDHPIHHADQIPNYQDVPATKYNFQPFYKVISFHSAFPAL